MSMLASAFSLTFRLTPRWLTEGACAVVGWTAIAVLMTWPQLGDPTRTAPGNLGDPLYFAFQLGWVDHAAIHELGSFWTTNAFQGEPGNLAFTDTILGYLPLSPLGLLVGGGQAGALLQLNVATVLATATAGIGAHALARAMGSGLPGALVAGAGFAFAPWRLEQIIHLNVISTGGMALALAFLLRGHGWSLRHGFEPERMHAGWVAAAWAVACWQLTFGFAIGLVFAYVMAGACVLLAIGWLVVRRPHVTRRFLLAETVGGAAFVAVGGLLTLPYLAIVDRFPEAARTEETLRLFSPPWQGLFTAPETNRLWGAPHAVQRESFFWVPEMVLLPGFALIGLAALGMALSVWSLRARLVMAAAVITTAVLALGVTAPGGGRFTYLPLFRTLPGWDALRTPGRLIIWVTLGLCLLAAGAVTRLVEETRRRPQTSTAILVATAAAVLPVSLVVVEGRGTVPQWPVATQPVPLRSLAAPVLVLPTGQVADYHIMLWSTEGFPLLTNGDSGFNPVFQVAMRTEASTFPDQGSVSALRARGVRTVVIVRSRTPGTLWEGAAEQPVAGLGITRRDLGDAVVYDLGPS